MQETMLIADSMHKRLRKGLKKCFPQTCCSPDGDSDTIFLTFRFQFVLSLRVRSVAWAHGITRYGIHSLMQIALAMDKVLTNWQNSAPACQPYCVLDYNENSYFEWKKNCFLTIKTLCYIVGVGLVLKCGKFHTFLTLPFCLLYYKNSWYFYNNFYIINVRNRNNF